MTRISVHLSATLFVLYCALPVLAQQLSKMTSVAVPPLVQFGGVLTDSNGKPLSGVVGITFSLYKESQSGAPLWMETQNVNADSRGHYTVMLGSSKSTGLQADVFASGEARWLGVQPEGQPEQPRILLLSVPYALKAADAETLGGGLHQLTHSIHRRGGLCLHRLTATRRLRARLLTYFEHDHSHNRGWRNNELHPALDKQYKPGKLSHLSEHLGEFGDWHYISRSHPGHP